MQRSRSLPAWRPALRRFATTVSALLAVLLVGDWLGQRPEHVKLVLVSGFGLTAATIVLMRSRYGQSTFGDAIAITLFCVGGLALLAVAVGLLGGVGVFFP